MVALPQVEQVLPARQAQWYCPFYPPAFFLKGLMLLITSPGGGGGGGACGALCENPLAAQTNKPKLSTNTGRYFFLRECFLLFTITGSFSHINLYIYNCNN